MLNDSLGVTANEFGDLGRVPSFLRGIFCLVCELTKGWDMKRT